MTTRPYNPDADAKDTRRTLANTLGSQELWQFATQDPLAFLAHFQSMLPGLDSDSGGHLLREMCVNVAQAQWARTRGVYQFDTALASAIADTPLDGLYDDVYSRLPEWCVYLVVEAEVGDAWLHGGYVASLAETSGALTIVVVAVVASGQLAKPYIYDAISFKTLPAQPLAFRERYVIAARNLLDQTLSPHLTEHATVRFEQFHELLLLRAAYLCTEEPDVRAPRERGAQPIKKKNNGPVRQWEVGVRFGQAYRQALAEHEKQAASRSGERARPRPHVRRAHWRTVLSGPRDQERRREVRWFPPTFVNAEGDELPVTIWNQKARKEGR